MHTIKLHIEKENDLYNSFNPDEDLISEDVKSYMLDQIRDKAIGDDVQLQIISPEEIDEERISRAVHNWAEKDKKVIKADFRKNVVQQIWMFGIGVVFIALSLMLESRVGVVWFTVLSTIGAFSMWEAASIWIVQNPKLRIRKRIIGKLERGIKISVRHM